MLRGLLAGLVLAASGANAQVTDARLTQATDRYAHGVLGDALEWGGMRITGPAGTIEVTLPQTHVFEDVEARVLDLDGDGRAEVLVVETDMAKGASLAVYDAEGKVAATPPIGATHRWLAPLGIGDLDGDGLPEIAYVDRPHLAMQLVIMTYRDRKLTEVARLSGVSNHRIGESTISGGFRDCGQGGEVILANASWTQVMAVAMQGGGDCLRAALAATRQVILNGRWIVADRFDPEIFWLGTENYVRLLDDKLFWKILGNTAFYTLITVPVSIVVALLLAVAVDSKIRGMAIYRSAFFYPVMIPSVAAGMVWVFLYAPGYGPINSALDAVGLPQLSWLSDSKWALPAIMVMSIWKFSGYFMLILLAALKLVPSDLYEAARLDGVNGWHRLVHITVPLISPSLYFVAIIGILHSYQVFDYGAMPESW